MSTKLVVLLLASAFLFSACKKSDNQGTDGPEANSNISESAVAEAGQHATSAEGASTPNLLSLNDPQAEAYDLQSMDFLDPQDTLHPYAACAFSSARSTCSSNVSTINWNGCSAGPATLTGGWTETWSGGFCANGANPGALTNGNSVTRTSTSQVLSLGSGAKITTNTTAHTAYDGTSIPATGITISMSGGVRTVVINGLRKVLVGPLGRTLFDHSITSAGLSVSGTRAGANRVITGSSTLYHNLAQYKAVHTFNSVTWGSSSCCYPTSGTVTSTLTGTRSGSTSLAFTATCGQAQFTDTDSTVSTVTLLQCN